MARRGEHIPSRGGWHFDSFPAAVRMLDVPGLDSHCCLPSSRLLSQRGSLPCGLSGLDALDSRVFELELQSM